MKNALFLTGAAARISQEVAIIDKLIEKKGLEIKPENTFLAGFSSGALNIGAINGCFKPDNPKSWDDYYKEEVLFKVKTKKVYKQKKFIPLNTKPLRKTIKSFLDECELKLLEDMPFETFILAFSYLRLSTLWTSNSYNRHKKIKLIDLMMATTAIPIIFPEQPIRTENNENRRFISGRFGDGGMGGSFKRFEHYLKKYVKQNQGFDKIYIISPMREVTKRDYDEFLKMLPTVEIFNLEFKETRLLKAFLEMISQNGFDTFVKRFHRWSQKKQIANEIFICIPNLDENYPILNFNLQREQYDDVCKWADEHPDHLAIPIHQYVQKFNQKPLQKARIQIRRRLRHRIYSFFTRKK